MKRKIENTECKRITTHDRFLPADSVVFSTIEKEGILLDLKDNYFYTLNETAAEIWKSMKRKKSVEEISVSLLKKYSATKERVLKSVKRQISGFLAAGAAKKIL